jgi:hypothetical protein
MPATETNANQADLPQPQNSNEHRGFGDNLENDSEHVDAPSSTGQKGTGNASSNPTVVLPNSIDHPENLPTAIVGVKDKPDVKEPSLPIIGFNLSSIVLLIISGFIIFLMIFLFAKEFDASSSIQIPTRENIPDSTYARKIELVRMIQEEKRSYREFIVQMSQMVLLNLLLPVLTAILGYIFASNKNRE